MRYKKTESSEKRAIRLAYDRKKNRARNILSINKRRGKIKQLPCEICGSVDTEAHHEDYDKPLEVRWLCFYHHRLLHKTIKSQGDNE